MDDGDKKPNNRRDHKPDVSIILPTPAVSKPDNSSSNNSSNNNDPFSTIDAHHDALERGRQSGRMAGQISGYRDGYHIGTATALQHGVELGLYQGVLDALSQQQQTTKTRAALQLALQQFPSPQQLLPSDNDKNNNNDSDASLQTIRARFKLLCVQLGYPKFALADLLLSSSSTNKEDAVESTTMAVSSEW